MRYVCSVCGYIYDEEKEKTLFSDLPDSWRCPVCKAAKSVFTPGEEERKPEPSAETEPLPLPDEDLLEMSTGELAALCSNLARGCEKQYKKEEEALFRQLADFFSSAVPKVPEGDPEHLAAQIQGDLKERYPALKAAADGAKDRGTKRICVWGEKVTNMLASLLAQYQEEGEALLEHTQVWVCSVCGFVYIGDAPPEICPVCKVPAWKFEKIEGRDRA